MFAQDAPIRDFHTWSCVNDTLQTYADALDRGDVDLLLGCFDAQARWVYTPGAVCQGHAALRAFFEERLRSFARTSHTVGPPVLRWRGGDEPIESTACVIAEHLLVDGSRYGVRARYVDRLRLDGDRALICERAVWVHLSEGTDRAYHMLPRKPPADRF